MTVLTGGSLRDRIKYGLWQYPPSQRIIRWSVNKLAFLWRSLMFRTTVVAVSGSLGKTTTKELLKNILANQWSTLATVHNQNDLFGVPRTLLRIRPWHRLAVIEVGIGSPGQMEHLAHLVRPDVAIFLNISRTHSTSFRSLDERAAEKFKLACRLKKNGICLFNADDHRLAERTGHLSQRIVSFGRAVDADFRVKDASGVWPQRLCLTIEHRGETFFFQTQLVGDHWCHSVASVIATAATLGVPMNAIASSIGKIEPFPGRIQPTVLPSGAVLFRDDYNASTTALQSSLSVLATADAARKILVLSDFSDFPGNRRKRLQHLATEITGKVDLCVLVGRDAAYGARRILRSKGSGPYAVAFSTLREASEALRAELKKGDLVLLKGRTTDHITRLYFSLIGSIGCWKDDCKRTVLCDFCPELGAGVQQALPSPQEKIRSETRETREELPLHQ